jgi:RNA polymerase sigma factor (sigma-70 family)
MSDTGTNNAGSGFDMEACLQGLRRQDQRAASDFVRELYPLVLKIVRSHLPRRASEEDLCQIVFIRILSNIGQYSGKVPIEHWVSRIAVNACLNALKAESVRPELRWSDLSSDQAALLEAIASDADTPDPYAGAASRDVIETLLSVLKPQDRLLITMLHLEGYSMDDVKKATGWNIATIKVRAFRARQKLKQTFQDLTSQGKL